MTVIARMTVLHLRTVAPYRAQGLLVFAVMAVAVGRSPAGLVPALAMLLAPLIAVHPFVVAEKAGLETLYAVLPVPRRTVVLGHYAWALAGFAATVAAGTALAEVLARVEGAPIGGVGTVLGLSWVLFALNMAIQLPLLLRFGYARISVLGTTLPIALVMVAVVKLHLTLASVQLWLPLLGVAGVALLGASAAVAMRSPA